MISDFEYVFICLLAICIPHLEKYIFRFTAHVLIGSFHVFDVDLCEFLYNLNINPFGDILFANIFSHSIGCLFIMLIASFIVQMLFSLMSFTCLFLFLLPEKIPRTILQRPMSKSILPMFSSRHSMVSGLTLKSFIHFEFIFLYGVRKYFSLILLHVTIHFPIQVHCSY